MTGETLTVTCTRHNRPCAYLDGPRGRGVKVWHQGTSEECDSPEFTVRREYSVSRPSAHLELLALHLNREAWERREKDSAPAGATGED